MCVFQGDLVTCGVLSGNKNFEGRLCDCVRATYLASPPLVVAYAIAGTVNIDFQTEPLGTFRVHVLTGAPGVRWPCFNMLLTPFVLWIISGTCPIGIVMNFCI